MQQAAPPAAELIETQVERLAAQLGGDTREQFQVAAWLVAEERQGQMQVSGGNWAPCDDQLVAPGGEPPYQCARQGQGEEQAQTRFGWCRHIRLRAGSRLDRAVPAFLGSHPMAPI
ncbi:hypothetical protein D3C84_867560 [compost metagenome]